MVSCSGKPDKPALVYKFGPGGGCLPRLGCRPFCFALPPSLRVGWRAVLPHILVDRQGQQWELAPGPLAPFLHDFRHDLWLKMWEGVAGKHRNSTGLQEGRRLSFSHVLVGQSGGWPRRHRRPYKHRFAQHAYSESVEFFPQLRPGHQRKG